MRHHPFRAAHEAFLFFFFQVGGQHQRMHFEAREPDDLGHLGVVHLEHVAQAAQDVVVVHCSRILFRCRAFQRGVLLRNVRR
ncbi:hypothetical protein D3C75_1176590 [compost metagenome]